MTSAGDVAIYTLVVIGVLLGVYFIFSIFRILVRGAAEASRLQNHREWLAEEQAKKQAAWVAQKKQAEENKAACDRGEHVWINDILQSVVRAGPGWQYCARYLDGRPCGATRKRPAA